jgi:hypothetical protein
MTSSRYDRPEDATNTATGAGQDQGRQGTPVAVQHALVRSIRHAARFAVGAVIQADSAGALGPVNVMVAVGFERTSAAAPLRASLEVALLGT